MLYVSFSFPFPPFPYPPFHCPQPPPFSLSSTSTPTSASCSSTSLALRSSPLPLVFSQCSVEPPLLSDLLLRVSIIMMTVTIMLVRGRLWEDIETLRHWDIETLRIIMVMVTFMLVRRCLWEDIEPQHQLLPRRQLPLGRWLPDFEMAQKSSISCFAILYFKRIIPAGVASMLADLVRRCKRTNWPLMSLFVAAVAKSNTQLIRMMSNNIDTKLAKLIKRNVARNVQLKAFVWWFKMVEAGAGCLQGFCSCAVGN